MAQLAGPTKRRSRLAIFGMCLFSIALVLLGALLLILGSYEAFTTEILGVTVSSDLPGILTVGAGIYVLFRAGHATRDEEENDPESHLHTVRADHHYDVNGDGVLDSDDFHDHD